MKGGGIVRKCILFFFVVVCSCKNDFTQNSGFNLSNDITEFSRKMENGDTLIIYTRIGACTQQHDETNIITKTNNNIYISSSFFESGDAGDSIGELETKKYIYNSNDSLSFENLFKYMKKKGTQNRQTNSEIFTIIYNNQKASFFSDGLNDHILSAVYYLKIMNRIYPEEKKYQPLIVPSESPERDSAQTER